MCEREGERMYENGFVRVGNVGRIDKGSKREKNRGGGRITMHRKDDKERISKNSNT